MTRTFQQTGYWNRRATLTIYMSRLPWLQRRKLRLESCGTCSNDLDDRKRRDASILFSLSNHCYRFIHTCSDRNIRQTASVEKTEVFNHLIQNQPYTKYLSYSSSALPNASCLASALTKASHSIRLLGTSTKIRRTVLTAPNPNKNAKGMLLLPPEAEIMADETNGLVKGVNFRRYQMRKRNGPNESARFANDRE